MIDKTLHTKKELKRLFMNLKDKGITDEMMGILIEVLWRDKTSSRTSGFFWPGGPDVILEWDDITRTVTLIPRPSVNPDSDYDPHFRFFSWISKPVLHRRFEPESLTLPDEEGLFVIYYDVDPVTRLQALAYTKNPDEFATANITMDKTVVAWIYWDATTGQALYFGDSRHGSEWPPQLHYWVHKTLNSQRQNGIAIIDATFEGDGTNNADADFGISAGSLWHEDIFNEAGPVSTADGLPVWYFDANGLPRYVEQPGKKVINTGTGMLGYNPPGLGIIEATDLNHVIYHVLATNCIKQPHIVIMGQAEYTTMQEAAAAIDGEIISLREALPHSNLMHIGSLVYQTSESYTNEVKARVVWTGTDENTVVTSLEVNEETGMLTLKQNKLPDIAVKLPGGKGISEIPFEFCINAAASEIFVVDCYVTSEYILNKVILESDGTINGVSINIDGTPVTGLNNLDINAVAVYTATAANLAPTGSRITITTSGVSTGTPTVIRGKIVL